MKARFHLPSLITHDITLCKINKSLLQSAAELFNTVRITGCSTLFIQSGEPVQGKVIRRTEYARTT